MFLVILIFILVCLQMETSGEEISRHLSDRHGVFGRLLVDLFRLLSNPEEGR